MSWMKKKNGALAAGAVQPFHWFPAFYYGLIASMAIYLGSWRSIDMLSDTFNMHFVDRAGDSFDFIIVGGGTAGSLLANRLSKTYTVLMLEAGGQPHPFQSVPLLTKHLWGHGEVDWSINSSPQSGAFFATNFRQASLHQGKGLGGTSGIDMMMYTRGHASDYDAWAEATEDTSWSYQELLQYFMKHEDYIGEWTLEEQYGQGGELRIQRPPYLGMAEIFVKAAQEVGYNKTDLGGEFGEGVDFLYYPIKNGRRQSSYEAFINGARISLPNLVIRKHSLVNKILIRNPNNNAYGVEYVRHGVKQAAYAKKEVILCAGAFNSPKLLMLSGLGPKGHLEQQGIKVAKDLPRVGWNLQEHPSVLLGPFLMNQSESFMMDRDLLSTQFFTNFLTHGTGPFTSTGSNAIGYFSSSLSEDGVPDIQLTFIGQGIYSRSASHLSEAVNLNEEVLNEFLGNYEESDSFFINVAYGRSKSRGQTLLTSSNPKENILVNPNYLAHEDDVKALKEGINIAINIVETSAIFRKYQGHLSLRKFPGCENWQYRSDQYWDCYIRQITLPSYDFGGTCSMGKGDNPELSVVDTTLRVIGTERLRVVDASVMPTIPVGNLNAATLVIAEKASSMILADWDGSLVTPVGSYSDVNNKNYSQIGYMSYDAFGGVKNSSMLRQVKLPDPDQWLKNLHPDKNKV